jgi:hypothetical protein
MGELMRHLTPEMLQMLNNYRLSRLFVALSQVLDLWASHGLATQIHALLTSDVDLVFTRLLGRIAYEQGAEGILVPSATRLGMNLVIFPDNVLPASQIALVDSQAPRLTIER